MQLEARVHKMASFACWGNCCWASCFAASCGKPKNDNLDLKGQSEAFLSIDSTIGTKRQMHQQLPELVKKQRVKSTGSQGAVQLICQVRQMPDARGVLCVTLPHTDDRSIKMTCGANASFERAIHPHFHSDCWLLERHRLPSCDGRRDTTH